MMFKLWVASWAVVSLAVAVVMVLVKVADDYDAVRWLMVKLPTGMAVIGYDTIRNEGDAFEYWQYIPNAWTIAVVLDTNIIIPILFRMLSVSDNAVVSLVAVCCLFCFTY